jgi:hypothetical protein
MSSSIRKVTFLQYNFSCPKPAGEKRHEQINLVKTVQKKEQKTSSTLALLNILVNVLSGKTHPYPKKMFLWSFLVT